MDWHRAAGYRHLNCSPAWAWAVQGVTGILSLRSGERCTGEAFTASEHPPSQPEEAIPNVCAGFCAVCEGAEQRAGQTDICCPGCEEAGILCVQSLSPGNLGLVTFGKAAHRISLQYPALENALFSCGCLGKAEVIPLLEKHGSCTVLLPCFPCC